MRLGGLGDLGARGLQVALRLGGAGAVEQSFAALVGQQAGAGQRLVERHRRLARLAGGDPHVAGRGQHAVACRVAGLEQVAPPVSNCCGRLGEAARPSAPRRAGRLLLGDDRLARRMRHGGAAASKAANRIIAIFSASTAIVRTIVSISCGFDSR